MKRPRNAYLTLSAVDRRFGHLRTGQRADTTAARGQTFCLRAAVQSVAWEYCRLIMALLWPDSQGSAG